MIELEGLKGLEGERAKRGNAITQKRGNQDGEDEEGIEWKTGVSTYGQSTAPFRTFASLLPLGLAQRAGFLDVDDGSEFCEFRRRSCAPLRIFVVLCAP